MILLGGGKMSFGSRLKELRNEKGISQKDVAINIGVAITCLLYTSDAADEL